jgi:hypothetical protein
MGILTDAFSSAGDLLDVLAKYGPLIEALITFIEKQQDDTVRAVAMSDITRGLQYASQTGDTSQLETAIRNSLRASSGLPIA